VAELKRNAWGGVRRLPSGRFQAHYRVDGDWFSAPSTFHTQREAEAFLAATRTSIERGTWVDPHGALVSLHDYASRWLAERPGLRPRTRELYEGLVRLHIDPGLGDLLLVRLGAAQVRTWYAGLANAEHPGASTVAKAYRLLRAILQTSVEDGVLAKNPCNIRGAGIERAKERPVATIAQVFDLANAIQPELRAMVLLATFAGLRLGELRALRRGRIDLEQRTVSVVEQFQQLANGTLVVGPPKSDAGYRTVTIPEAIVPEIAGHLSAYVDSDDCNLVFSGTKGQPLRLASFYRAWSKAVAAVSLEGFRFHDLRHTGNTLAAATGASTKELMARMGHASTRAALIYQHATSERDAVIASALSEMISQTSRDAGKRPPTTSTFRTDSQPEI
jgi:integrase